MSTPPPPDPDSSEERSMNAVEATVLTIVSIFVLGLVYNFVTQLWPAGARDRGMSAALQLVVYSAFLLVLRILYFPKTSPKIICALGPGRWVYYPIAILLGLAIQFPASGLYEAVLSRFPDTSPVADFAEAFSTLPMWKKAAAAVGLVITTPLIEELVFRGALFGTLRKRHSPMIVVLITSSLFALIHFQPQLYLPIGMVGAAIAFMRVASGSIWPGVLVHASFNGLTFYAIATGATESSAANETTPVREVVIGTVVTAGLLALTDFLRQREKEKQPQIEEEKP